MKQFKDHFDAFSPPPGAEERIYRSITQPRPAGHRRRLVPIAALTALLTLLAATTVAAIPMIRSHFVPDVGIVQTPGDGSELAYRYLIPQKGETTRMHYRFGYIYGDQALVYLSTNQARRELEQMTALEGTAITLDAGLIRMTADGDDHTYIYRLRFSGLDESALTDGIPLLGDTIRFDRTPADYRQYLLGDDQIRVKLIPLAADNSAFFYQLDPLPAEGESRHLYLDGSLLDAAGNEYLPVTVVEPGKFGEGLLYLAEPPAAPIESYLCREIKISHNAPDSAEFAVNVPAPGESSEISATLHLPYNREITDASVTLIHTSAGQDKNFPMGALGMATPDVAEGNLRTHIEISYSREYREYLDQFLEYVTMDPHNETPLPPMAPRMQLLQLEDRSGYIHHYVDDGTGTLQLTVGAVTDTYTINSTIPLN